MAGDLIARIAAQTCRQAGLSIVYTELLDFDGDEIYFANLPELAGRTFGEALLAFEDSALIGLRPAGGRPTLNPPMDTIIAAGDEVIAISARRRHGPLDERAVSGRRGRDARSASPTRRRPNGRWSSAGTGAPRRSSASSTATSRPARR